MDSRILLADFRKAVESFEQALSGGDTKSDLEQAGCIQYFEFCFELAWKSIQAMSRELGLTDCDSPKACFRQAFVHHWLDDEILWLEILSDRNRMSHTYSATDAVKVYSSLDRYLPAFQDLLLALKTERDRWP